MDMSWAKRVSQEPFEPLEQAPWGEQEMQSLLAWLSIDETEPDVFEQPRFPIRLRVVIIVGATSLLWAMIAAAVWILV